MPTGALVVGTIVLWGGRRPWLEWDLDGLVSDHLDLKKGD